jgi:hypothetical protein
LSGAKFNHDAILETMRVGLREGMNATLVGSSRLVRRQLSRPGMGFLYRVAKGSAKGRNLRARGYHRASLPGQPPAVNTNRLRASWSVETVGNRPDGFANIFEDGRSIVLRYGSNVPYAPMLEFGTRRMKPRPYIKPTLPQISKISVRFFEIAIKKQFARTP